MDEVQDRLQELDASKSDAYHLDSIRLAGVREALGGCRAEDSGMMLRAVGELMRRGYSADDIAAKLKAKE